MGPPSQVTVHPLVLLSVVDHYARVAKDTKKRVVGVLLGSVSKAEVDITNSFAGAAPVRPRIGRARGAARGPLRRSSLLHCHLTHRMLLRSRSSV